MSRCSLSNESATKKQKIRTFFTTSEKTEDHHVDAKFHAGFEKKGFSSILQLLASLNRDQRQKGAKKNLFSTLRSILRRKEL